MAFCGDGIGRTRVRHPIPGGARGTAMHGRVVPRTRPATSAAPCENRRSPRAFSRRAPGPTGWVARPSWCGAARHRTEAPRENRAAARPLPALFDRPPVRRRLPPTWIDLAMSTLPDKEQRELESLLDRISTGSIEDVDELQPQDIELLRRVYGDGEELQDLFDRLRGDVD